MRYPDFESERPFAMPASYRKRVEVLSRDQLVEALCREAELRGRWEWVVGEVAAGRFSREMADAAFHGAALVRSQSSS